MKIVGGQRPLRYLPLVHVLLYCGLFSAAYFVVVLQVVENIVKEEKIQQRGKTATVLLGRDTRPSGHSLVEAAFKVRLVTWNSYCKSPFPYLNGLSGCDGSVWLIITVKYISMKEL
jgi:hypothetical protein